MKIGSFFKNKLSVAIVIIVFVQIVLMFQGFDICDDGFVLTFYQQIFSDPVSVEYNFLYWFSGILGGIWYQIYEDGGILWFRILGVVLNTGTFIVSFHVLKRYVPNLFLILGLVMVLFVNDYGFLTFYHNQITSFFTVLIVYCISNALFRKKYNLLFLAGFIFVLNGLTRIPNFILGTLFLAIPLYHYLNKNSFKSSIKPIIISSFGIFSGFIFAYLILLFSGQIEVIENALYTMMDVGNTEGSSHNFKSVFMAQYYNYYAIVYAFIPLILIFIAVTLLFRFIKNSKPLMYILATVFMLVMVFWFQRNGIFSIYTLAYIGAIWITLSKKSAVEARIVAFLAFVMLFTMTLGSGGGVKNSGYMAIWIGFPLFYLALPLILKGQDNLLRLFYPNSKSESDKYSISKILVYTITLAFLLLKAHNISGKAYFDNGSRLDKTYAINNIKARYIYTTKKRADIVNNVLLNLGKYVKPGDYLFAYDHIPMIHFLTETKAYTYNPWPGIYDHYSFNKKIKKAENNIADLPIVLLQKFETIKDFSDPLPNYMIPEKNDAILHGSKSIKAMNAFLERHNYKEVWSDSYFTIYKSYNSSNRVN
ncbi:hypothetical protein [Winogradskyella sp. PE311]|uniref:hypothetical protein n=1 Tax=Winogradskyella sp. PE311 TaxID=3366943 RepID=UPI00397F24BB